MEKKSIIKDKEKWMKKVAILASELTPQQREFCEAYLWTDTGTAAALHAGYSDSCANVTASKLLKQPAIQEYIEALQAVREIASSIDDMTIIRMQLNIYQMAVEDKDLKAANTALDQLSKMIGTYNKAKSKPKDEDLMSSKDEQEKQNIVDIIKKVGERKSGLA